MDDINELWEAFRRDIKLQWNFSECLQQFVDFIKKQTGTRIDPIIDSLTLGYLGSPFREDIKFQEIPNFEINKIVVLSPELTIRLEDTFDKAIESVGKSLPPTIINAIKLLFSKLYQDSTINIRQTIIQFLEEIG